MIDKPVINTDLKKYDKAYVVEDDILWEVFGDGYSQAEVIWDKENICELLNTLHKENEQLKQEIKQYWKCRDKWKQEAKELKEENEQLQLELETHKHPLWSTREAERKLSEVTNNLANEIKKNGLLNEEINQLRIENMRLKKKVVMVYE